MTSLAAADAPAIREAWKETHAKAVYDQRISLENAPDLHAKHTPYHPYELLVTNFRYGHGPWTRDVLIYTTQRYADGSTSLRCTTMRPASLDEQPAWLEDVIARVVAKAEETYPTMPQPKE